MRAQRPADNHHSVSQYFLPIVILFDILHDDCTRGAPQFTPISLTEGDFCHQQVHNRKPATLRQSATDLPYPGLYTYTLDIHSLGRIPALTLETTT